MIAATNLSYEAGVKVRKARTTAQKALHDRGLAVVLGRARTGAAIETPLADRAKGRTHVGPERGEG